MIFGGQADLGGAGADGDNSFFIPVALDPSPVPSIASPRSNSEAFEQRKAANDKEYFARQSAMVDKRSEARSSQASTPHIAFQEKPRRPSSEYEASTPKEPARKLSKSSKSDNSVASQSSPPASDDKSAKPSNGKLDEFKLQDAPKSKKLINKTSHVAGLMENAPPGSADQSLEKDIVGQSTDSPSRSDPPNKFGSPIHMRENSTRDDDKRPSQESTGFKGTVDSGTPKSVLRKEVPSSTASRTGMYVNHSDITYTNGYFFFF